MVRLGSALSMREPTREQIAIRLPLWQVKALQAIREADGVPVTRQIECAIRDRLEARGITKDGKKAGLRRADTRRRPSARKRQS